MGTIIGINCKYFYYNDSNKKIKDIFDRIIVEPMFRCTISNNNFVFNDNNKPTLDIINIKIPNNVDDNIDIMDNRAKEIVRIETKKLLPLGTNGIKTCSSCKFIILKSLCRDKKSK